MPSDVTVGWKAEEGRKVWNGQGYHLLAMPLRCIRCCRLPNMDKKKKCWTPL
jgi:hypothetical protein